MLGVDSTRHLGHLLTGAFSADEIAVEGPAGVRIISGGSGLRELADLSKNERATILEKILAYCRQYDWTVIDTSPGIGSNVTDFLGIAAEILLVTTPEPTAVRDTYAALKTVSRKLPETPVRLVINSASPRSARDAVAAINGVALKFLGKSYTNWHNIDADDLVRRSVRDRQVLAESFPRSQAAVAMRNLANTLNCSTFRRNRHI
jgi:flagellar biosynthesis protein FlhG